MANDTAKALSIPLPDYHSILHKMNMGDMTWLTDIPEIYLKPSPSLKGCPTSYDKNGGKGKGNDKKPFQVLNMSKNQKFDDFCTKIAWAKLNEVIKKAS